MLRTARLLSAPPKMARQAPANPLVAIIGATGTGKSQLAVEIAVRFNGEIVNGDAMQLYHGLPIITNKISVEERRGIPHHLLGCIGLEEQTWTVTSFVSKALKVIDEIRSRGKLPIVVGGTHYYIQALLFKGALVRDGQNQSQSGESLQDMPKRWPVLEESTEKMLEKLHEVDPIMANRWHPNDRRKIQRSLEIYLETGKKASDIYEEQKPRRQVSPFSDQDFSNASIEKEPSTTSRVRFSTLIFWIHASQDILRDRLDNRVDAMLKAGLLKEIDDLEAFLQAQVQAGETVDQSKGIWVSIGYKEFKRHRQSRQQGNMDSLALSKLYTEAVEQTKAATRQYAKRQVRWIRSKLLSALIDAEAKDYLMPLDVEGPATDLTKRFLAGVALPNPTQVSDVAEELLKLKEQDGSSASKHLWMKKTCDVCNVTGTTESQWTQHIKSRAHRKAVSKSNAREYASGVYRETKTG
ncbi:IPP transferase-domain-containing protein [Cryomyces antarcticus]